METPIDLQLLANFTAVAEHASLTKAAKQLGVAKGTVSRNLALLEAKLGVELVHRTTHHVALSTAGLALHERTHAHVAALRSAAAALPERERAPSGLLRITAPSDFGTIVLPAVLSAFTRRHPGVRFDVRLTSVRVDLSKEGYDLAIRAASDSPGEPTFVARRLGKSAGAFYAAPSYLARRGRPKELLEERHRWVLHSALVRALRLRTDTLPFLVDDFVLARELLRDGVGVGMLPAFVGAPDVREGLLEELPSLLPSLPMGDLMVLHSSRRPIPRKVTAFRDFLIEALRAGHVAA